MMRVFVRASLLLVAIAAWLAAFQTVSAGPAVLYTFSAPTLGIAPTSRLVLGSDGNLYGTTSEGGTNGAGTVFRVSVEGAFSNLYSFPPATNSFGEVIYDLFPNDLMQGTDGNFYGTTQRGGSNFSGTIYAISPPGIFSNLYTFDAGGAAPTGPLAEGTDGNFYGTTRYGGINGTGTIFQLTPAGAFTSLYSFGKSVAGSTATNGTIPNTLIPGTNGIFYGTTQQGGTDNAGTFFKFTLLEGLTQINSFNGSAPGANPITPTGFLVPGTNGNFYGTSLFGGSQGGGTIYEVIKTGGVNLLHSFPQLDAGASSTLTLANDGNFYGTSSVNGLNGNGTLFKMTPEGAFSYYTFGALNTNSENAGGSNPLGAMAADNVGNLYGACAAGGTNGSGVVFQIYGPGFLPPYFVSVTNPPPPHTNVLEGAPVTLSYSAQGIAPLTSQWLLDGIAITNGDDFLGAQSDTLIISQVFGRDAGSYSLVISNTWGSLTSSVTALTVTPPGISISSPAANANVITPLFSGTATNAPLFANTPGSAAQLTLVNYTITQSLGGSNVSGFATLTSGGKGASNWSFTATPYPGTNVVSVQVEDASGNISSAVKRTFFYDVPAPLTITKIGSGTGTFTITNGAMLALGRAYTITAKPSSSIFTSWVNNGIISFTPTISFVMQSNLVLTADFMAEQRPAVFISFPAPNVRSGSTNFTGTAETSPVLPGANSNNVRLTKVAYWITNQLSDSVISGLAELTSGTGAISNWSIAAAPSPGTNILAMQSEDISGDLSPVVVRTFFHKVPSRFTLSKSGGGNGTITEAASIPGDIPPTNGATLNIGERYALVARPDSRSTFSGWAGATGPGITNPVLSFIMQANMAVTAIFTAIPPVVTISSPPENLRTIAPVFNGTAHGHFPISNVVCTLNGAKSFASVKSGGGSVSSWSINLLSSPGTNILTVYCVDVNGTQSAPVSRHFFYKVPALLVVTNAGPGTGTFRGSASIPRDTVPANGAMLNIGESYTITAIPGSSSLFNSWSSVAEGSSPVASTTPTLRFVMESNLELTANFVTNFFPAVAGTYNGLFYPASGVRAENSGMLYNLVLRNTGAFTGQLLTAATNYHFATNFDSSGNAAINLGTLNVALALDTATPQITGIVSGSRFSANLIGDLASNVLQPASYTLLLSSTAGVSAVSPSGDGFALVSNKSGIVTLSGALADGTSYSQAVPVSASGDLPVYASLYTKAASTNAGLLLGWINLTNLEAAAPTNALMWIKKPSRATMLYTNGFTNILSVRGGVWVAPPAGTAAISLTNGQLVVTNGGFSAEFAYISVNSNNLVTNPGGAVVGSINPKTGFLVITADGITNYGVVVQATTNGGGYFLTSTNAGGMILQP